MKRSILYSFLLIVGTSTINNLNAQQQEIVIGTGTGSDFETPLTRFFEHGASETIYHASDIGATETETITAFGWNLVQNPYSEPTKNVSIYMKMSDQSEVESTTSLDGYTLVYSGSIDNDVEGWQKIVLDKPFVYDDITKNLMVLAIHNSGDFANDAPKYANTNQYENINVLNSSSRYSDIDNAWDETKTMSLSANRPDIKLYLKEVLSTVEIEGENSLRIFPTPSKDVVNISGNQEMVSVALYNVVGQRVISEQVDGKEVVLDLSGISSGTYIVNISYKNGYSKTTKVVKE